MKYKGTYVIVYNEANCNLKMPLPLILSAFALVYNEADCNLIF